MSLLHSYSSIYECIRYCERRSIEMESEAGIYRLTTAELSLHVTSGTGSELMYIYIAIYTKLIHAFWTLIATRCTRWRLCGMSRCTCNYVRSMSRGRSTSSLGERRKCHRTTITRRGHGWKTAEKRHFRNGLIFNFSIDKAHAPPLTSSQLPIGNRCL